MADNGGSAGGRKGEGCVPANPPRARRILAANSAVDDLQLPRCGPPPQGRGGPRGWDPHALGSLQWRRCAHGEFGILGPANVARARTRMSNKGGRASARLRTYNRHASTVEAGAAKDTHPPEIGLALSTAPPPTIGFFFSRQAPERSARQLVGRARPAVRAKRSKKDSRAIARACDALRAASSTRVSTGATQPLHSGRASARKRVPVPIAGGVHIGAALRSVCGAAEERPAEARGGRRDASAFGWAPR